MVTYQISSIQGNIEKAALFLQVFHNCNLNALTINDINSIFPNNPPNFKNIIINCLHQDIYDKNVIYERIKKRIINWLDPKNGTVVRDSKIYNNIDPKYIVEVYHLIQPYTFIKYP